MIADHSICRLRFKEKELREIHIIPKFATDWQKDLSVHLRKGGKL
jgi:hypothetical protein